MSTLNDLNFTMVLYTDDGNAKIARMPVNILMPSAANIISNYWVDKEQTFYTHIAGEYDGQTILKYSLRN
jgi:hypothetical protein